MILLMIVVWQLMMRKELFVSGTDAVLSMAFSNVRRGTLATLGKSTPSVRYWSIIDSGITSRRSDPSSRPHTSNIPSLVHTRRGKSFGHQVASFCFVPDIPGANHLQHTLVMTKDGFLDINRPPVPAVHCWSPRGELVAAVGNGSSYLYTPDRSLPEALSNIDPWQLTIEHSTTYSPPTGSGSAAPPQEVQGDTLETENTETIAEPPLESPAPAEKLGSTQTRPGYIPFPVLDDALNSSLTATSSLSVSREASQDKREKSPAAITSRRYGGTDRPQGPASTRPSRQNSRGPASRKNILDTSVTPSMTPVQKIPRPLKDVHKAFQYDISEIMRARVLQGYGLDSMVHNALVTSRNPLGAEGKDLMPMMWAWLEVEPSKVYNFDFAYQGVLSVWEGFAPLSGPGRVPIMIVSDDPAAMQRSTSGRGHKRSSARAKERAQAEQTSLRQQYENAVDIMNGRKHHGTQRVWPRWATSTSKVSRRQLGLTLCDWNLIDDELVEQILKWDTDGVPERAACWAIFLGKSDLAMQILMRNRDEKLQMLSGVVRTLVDPVVRSGSSFDSWREHAKRLALRSQSIYVRALLSRLAGDEWMDILLEEMTMPLRERLAIALLFLPDEQLGRYLRELLDGLVRDGNIEGLLVTGLNPLGLQIIQGYVDNTGDVQTAASLFCCISPARWHHVPSLSDRRSAHAQHSQTAANLTDLARAEKWVETYQELLDCWKFFHHRVHFDMLRGNAVVNSIRNGEVAHHEWVPRQLEVRCNYCNKIANSSAPMALSTPSEGGPEGNSESTPAPGVTGLGTSPTSISNVTVPPTNGGASNQRVQTDFCPWCSRRLPRCSICLMSIGIPNDDIRNIELSEMPEKRDTANDAMVFCQTCRHGGHSGHILDWFLGPNGDGNGHEVCPVADCDCRCSSF
ncbi:uncharacterized protein EI90DRAFT_698176 [Cantharellus anzutake]|uniref:uncharacterized protein n=1 Tax=Cantharellus anzutake TaxID=1750568 RepID=UPI0019051F88|nr:uncharacterized protein EI90DRAFT_698176 [Cantharellus anzutake]KAF8332750.1 hypothetical protein EI90DRAFT_698176 [Cantharellus anzutake]